MALFVRFPSSDFPFPSAFFQCCVLLSCIHLSRKALKVSIVLILYSYNGIRVYHNHISFVVFFFLIPLSFVVTTQFVFIFFVTFRYFTFFPFSQSNSQYRLSFFVNFFLWRFKLYHYYYYYYIEFQWSPKTSDKRLKIDGKLRTKWRLYWTQVAYEK
jgi:hypothetical protein